jgi:hypothetical protein
MQALLLNSNLNVRRCGIWKLHRVGTNGPDVGEGAKDGHVACATVLEIDLITVHDLVLGGATRPEPESNDDNHQGSALDNER